MVAVAQTAVDPPATQAAVVEYDVAPGSPPGVVAMILVGLTLAMVGLYDPNAILAILEPVTKPVTTLAVAAPVWGVSKLYTPGLVVTEQAIGLIPKSTPITLALLTVTVLGLVFVAAAVMVYPETAVKER
jgi:hypothetical protein